MSGVSKMMHCGILINMLYCFVRHTHRNQADLGLSLSIYPHHSTQCLLVQKAIALTGMLNLLPLTSIFNELCIHKRGVGTVQSQSTSDLDTQKKTDAHSSTTSQPSTSSGPSSASFDEPSSSGVSNTARYKI